MERFLHNGLTFRFVGSPQRPRLILVLKVLTDGVGARVQLISETKFWQQIRARLKYSCISLAIP